MFGEGGAFGALSLQGGAVGFVAVWAVAVSIQRRSCHLIDVSIRVFERKGACSFAGPVFLQSRRDARPIGRRDKRYAIRHHSPRRRLTQMSPPIFQH